MQKVKKYRSNPSSWYNIELTSLSLTEARSATELMYWLQNLPQSLSVSSLRTSCSRACRQPDPGQQLGIAIRVVRVGLPEEECPASQDQRDHPGLLISFHQPCLVIRFAVESDYDEFESFLTALTIVVSARLKREAAFLYLVFDKTL